MFWVLIMYLDLNYVISMHLNFEICKLVDCCCEVFEFGFEFGNGFGFEFGFGFGFEFWILIWK
jgi:hypothetical protein